MRKAFFAVMATLVLATTSAMASISGTLLPAVPDSISWDHAAPQTNTSGYSGTYSHYYMWRVTGDTSWSFGPTTSHATSPVKKVLNFLPANTAIEVKSVLVDGSFVFTTNTITFTTKPLPRPAWLSSPAIISAPISTKVSFNYDVSVPTKVFAYYSGYSHSSDTVTVTGTGSSYVMITSPNTPGTTYTINKLYAYAVGREVADTFITFSDFTVPTWIRPTVSGITFSSVSQDSFRVTTNVTKGNAATATIIVRNLDSAGSITAIHPVITISSDTVITWFRVGTPNTNYGEKVSISSAGGSDSMTAYQRTLQVFAPQIIGADTINATINSTDLIVRVKTNGRSYWPSSSANVWLKWADKNGNIFTAAPQTIAGSTATVSATFTGLSNLKLNPTVNTATVYIQNIAGLIDSQMISFVVKAPRLAVPIDDGWYLEGSSSFELRLWSVNTRPVSIDPYNLYAFVNVIGSGLVDTVLLRPNQVGVTDFLKKDTIGGRVGGTAYQVCLATRNIDGVWYVTRSQNTTTIPPADPTFFISNAIVTTETSVSYEVHGCMNGKARYLDVEIALPGSINSPIQVIPHGYKGTGNFSATGAFSGLTACTDYVITAVTHDGSHGEEITDSLSSRTKCYSTGIDEASDAGVTVFPNPATDVITITGASGDVVIYSMDGREIISQSVIEKTLTIDVSRLIPGTYIIKGDGFVSRLFKI